jgi:hypothetical protein
MQNRYVADIGDYVKLAILRQLAPGRRFGVAWWLFPDENHNNDGGHREYLHRPDEWRRFDHGLFDGLLTIDKNHTREVAALEPFLQGALFARELVPCDLRPFSRRPAERRRWLSDIKLMFKSRNLIFLDPDNGIASERSKPTWRRAGKSVFIDEMKSLKECDQAIVIYHHQGMFKGGHEAELRSLAGRLNESGFRVCGALRAKPWSPRAFFILDGDEELCIQAQNIATIWGGQIEWYSGAMLGLNPACYNSQLLH